MYIFIRQFFECYVLCLFLGGSLADLIERSKNSREVMGEGDLKQLLIQIAQVIVKERNICTELFYFQSIL